jgi:hypothetical protein
VNSSDSLVPVTGHVDWVDVAESLDTDGHAVIRGLLGREECEVIQRMYPEQDAFRSRVVMARHGFGRGEYKYFSYPLPAVLQELRQTIYPQLATIANRWNGQMKIPVSFPPRLDDFLERCHHAGQGRPTPLLLQYGAGDYNCLHQDLYGEHVFPLQVAILLSAPHRDFTGGEFVMTENATAGMSRATVVGLRQGDAVVFPVNHRPVAGKRAGVRRVAMRHGVSQIHEGRRYTVGIIFHDAM